MNLTENSISAELRAGHQAVQQDWPALASYLSSCGLELSQVPRPRQFAGGLANLNYLLVVNGRPTVLRRPPLGALPPGAYNVEREFRILSRLWAGFSLAPRGLHFCSDPAIIGTPFQLLEYRQGLIVRSDLPAPLSARPNIGRILADDLLDVLIQLHSIDPASVGLNDLGKPEGFINRTVEGWISRANLSAEGRTDSECHALIKELSRWLRAHRVPDGRSSLIHNDVKLDNILLDADSLKPVAMLDWDQCTQGDSLFDLATTLSYYTEAGDPHGMRQLKQMPTATLGFPTRQEVAERYSKMAGRDLSDFKFYRVLAIFKLAIIFQQLHQRYCSGATNDPRYAAFGTLVDDILEFARLVAQGSLF